MDEVYSVSIAIEHETLRNISESDITSKVLPGLEKVQGILETRGYLIEKKYEHSIQNEKGLPKNYRQVPSSITITLKDLSKTENKTRKDVLKMMQRDFHDIAMQHLL